MTTNNTNNTNTAKPTVVGATRSELVLGAARSLLRWFAQAPSTLAAAMSGLVVFFTWFSHGLFYAVGDVAPMVKPSLGKEALNVWTHQNSAAGGATWEISRSWEWLFSKVSSLPLADYTTGQHLLFACCFAFAAAGAASFAARFVQRGWLAALCGVIVAWSPYEMLQMPSPLPLVATGVCGFTLSFAFIEARGSKVARWRWLLAWIPASYVMLNPPLIVLCLATAAIAPLFAVLLGARTVPTSRLLRRHAVTGLVLGMGASWWLVPAYIALTGARAGDAVRAQTDVLAWSWTHRNSSLANVVRLRAHWAFPDSFYVGSAGSLGQFPWNVMLWALPIAAVASLWLSANKRVVRWLVGLVVVLVFVSKGVHAPFGGVNVWMFEHLPAMYLFREPFSKFGLFLALFMVVLAAMAAEGAHTKLAASSSLPRAAWLAFPLVPLLVSFPVYTGSLANTNEQVSVPADWFAAAANINESPLQGRVLVLPLADFYQMPTTWGYYGIDTLPRQLITRPVIQRIPESYIGDRPQYDALMRATERALAGNDMVRAASLLDALGVSHIVLRHDYDLASTIRTPQIKITSRALTAVLPEISGLKRTLDTALVDVFALETRESLSVLAPVGESAYLDLSRVGVEDSRAILRTAVDASSAMIPSDLLPAGTPAAWITPSAAGKYQAGVSGQATLVPTGAASYRIVVDNNTRLVDVTTIGQRGAVAPSRQDIVLAPRPVDVLIVNGATRREGDVVSIAAATPVSVTTSTTTDLTRRWRELADCNNYDNTSFTENGMSKTQSSDGLLTLTASRHAACTSLEVPAAPASGVREVALDVRSVSGASARVCLLVDNKCAEIRAELLDDGWARVFMQANGGAAVRLYSYADEPTGPVKTVTEYRNVAVTTLQVDPPMIISPSSLRQVSGAVTATDSVIEVAAGDAIQIGAASKIADCSRDDDRTPGQLGMTAQTTERAVTLTANEHKACIKYALDLEPGVSYTLSFTGSYVGKVGPSVCVWQLRVGKCANAVLESAGQAATKYEVEFISTTRQAELFLYADAKAGPIRITYADLAVSLTPSARFAVVPAAENPAATVTVVSGDSPKWRATLTPRSGDVEPLFVLATREAFDPYWTLSGLPKGAIAVPTLVDGYRQGWVVSNLTVAADVTITYEGRRYGMLALLLSALVVLLSVMAALGRQVVRIRGRSSEVHLIADAEWQAHLLANGGSISGALLEQLKGNKEPQQRWPS
jgi:arabinofuranan 3-O-arabinosyltransferase